MADNLPKDTVSKPGTEATFAVTVQGSASGVPVQVQGVAGATSDVELHDHGTPSQHLGIDAAGKAAVAPAVATAAAPTYSEGAIVSLSTDLAGGLRTAASGGGGLTDTQLRASPVPVSGPLTDTQLRASAVPVSNASLPLPSGASTEATLALIKAKTDNLDVLLSTRTKPADTQKVDGSAVTQPVSGTFWQATQPVSGPLTDAQLRASAVPVSNATLPLPTGAATSANQATEIASLSSIDAKLTNPLPVSGTVTANQGTAAGIAGAWPVKVTDGTNSMPTGDSSARTIHVTEDSPALKGTSEIDSTVTAIHVATKSPNGADVGLVVRQVPDTDFNAMLLGMLGEIRLEMRIANELLAEGLTVRRFVDPDQLRRDPSFAEPTIYQQPS